MNSDRNFIDIIQQNASDTDGLTKQAGMKSSIGVQKSVKPRKSVP